MSTSLFFNYFLVTFVFSGFDVSTVAVNGDEAAFHPENSMFLIRGGYRPAQPDLTKYIVSIRRAKVSQYFGDSHFCTGIIISTRAILTAAHCFVHPDGVAHASDVAVVASTPQRLRRANSTQILQVSKIVAHDKFSRVGNAFDIAILRLKTDIKVDNDTAEAAPIAEQPPPFGSECVIIGWGRIFNYGPLVDDALYANVTLSRCSVARRSTEDVVCTDDIGKGVGSSDSGGPLFCNNTVVGITSYSVIVGGMITLEDAFTDVWYYRSWILANANGQSPRSFLWDICSLPISLALCVLLFVVMY